MRGSCVSRSNQSWLFGIGTSSVRGRRRRPGRRRHELPLSAPSRWDPRALDVGGTIKATALAACPAPPVTAVFLGLVPAVLTRQCRGSRGTAPCLNHQMKVLVFLVEELVLLLLGRLLPQLNTTTTTVSVATAHHVVIITVIIHDSNAESRCGVRGIQGVMMR